MMRPSVHALESDSDRESVISLHSGADSNDHEDSMQKRRESLHIFDAKPGVVTGRGKHSGTDSKPAHCCKSTHSYRIRWAFLKRDGF